MDSERDSREPANPWAVGASIPRRDGPEKVLGSARYVDDLSLPGMWFGGTVRTPQPRGVVTGLNRDLGFDWSQVVVVTAADLPGENVIALIADDQPALVPIGGESRHWAEAVALVAAPDRRTLARALQAMTVTMEPLPAILTLDDALALPEPPVVKSVSTGRGDPERVFAHAPHVWEGSYFVPHQEQLYIEPQGMIASWEGEVVRVVGSLQCPYYIHKALMRLFRLEENQVQVEQAVTGGGFGGKEDYPSMIAAHACLLARKAGRPVKIIYGRGEDIEATTKRHPCRVDLRSAMDEDGRFLALSARVHFDQGAYVTLTPVVMSRGLLHASGPYRWPDIHIVSRSILTHTPPNGAFRGFGAPQTQWAMERHIDRIARRLGWDPLALKQKNLLHQGDQTATGQVLRESVGGEACVKAALEDSRYAELRAMYQDEEIQQRGERRIRRGIGAAVFFHGAGFTGSGEKKLKGKAAVDLLPGGKLQIRTASTDIGQGTETIFPQIAAEASGFALNRVSMAAVKTPGVPDSGPTVASRTCMVVGKVVEMAASRVAETVKNFVAKQYAVPVSEIILDGNQVIHPKGKASLEMVCNGLLLAKGPVSFTETYQPPDNIVWDEENYQGDAYPCYAWGCDVAEVEVDIDTWEVQVTRFIAAQDVGKAVHPVLCAGQVEGGSLQALGWALWEDVVWKEGRIRNGRMTNYIIPTAQDAPTFVTHLVEIPYSFGPFGAKGVGELPMDGGAPAVAEAIAQALNIDFTDLPLTPEALARAVSRSVP